MSLLLDEIWDAQPHWYDYENRINLKENTLMLGGGQSVHLMCKVIVYITVDTLSPMKENIVEQGTIKFVYDTIHCPLASEFQCSPAFPSEGYDKELTVSYVIRKDNYILTNGHGLEYQSDYKLVCSANPMPKPYANSLFLMINGEDIHNQTEYYNCVKKVQGKKST